MKPSDFQKTVQCRFESCLKKVVRHVVKDYQQGIKTTTKIKKFSFCELPEIVRRKSGCLGRLRNGLYDLSMYAVMIFVSYDDELAEALKTVVRTKPRNLC